ncbi:hypothetical protein Pint_12023 [Pistacia integerrima]|uniref:Uncharacterized protein n=1 Tax=Pistacia integerrima TaxID=434235 RepID=A0ACC0XL01_9ROSI|nr:hypothetical protein Pint_12023 [Pistacia integerrima]
MSSSSSQPIMASNSPQPIVASSSSQPIMASSSSQPIMASSSPQPIMFRSSPQPIMASSSSQPIMASSSSKSPPQRMDDLTRYIPLHKSILEGNLESVKRLCDSDDHALEARITVNFDTALHVAVRVGSTVNHISEYLVDKMPRDQMILKNNEGNTVLSIAAIVGNVQAAEKIIRKEPYLSEVANNSGWIPLMEAARHAQKEMTTYLLRVKDKFKTLVPSSEDKAGVFFVNLLIIAGFYDLALDLVRRHSIFATTDLYGGESLLGTLAGEPSAFPSGAELGVHEVVEEIVKSFPDAIWFSDAENHNALQIAVLNRREKAFNLLKQMSGCENMLMMSEDTSGNNILHLAGKLAPEYQLNHIPGAALQMQRELQWFQVL